MSEPKTHVLKCWPEHFHALRKGLKTCEVRLNDRDFKEGEFLLLAEFNPETDTYTEETDVYKVTHVLHGGQFGIEKGYVVMSLE